MLCSCPDDLAHSGVADASGGVVDDALECFLVVGVDHQTEISNDILHLLALVERQAAVHTVGDAFLAHDLLEDSALCVGAVEDSYLIIRYLLTSVQLTDLVGHNVAFFHIAIGFGYLYAFALFLFREHILVNLSLVLGNQTVSCLHDGLCGAVVLLQLEDFCTIELLGEVEDIVDLSSTERVDALGIVAHHTYTLVLCRQL